MAVDTNAIDELAARLRPSYSHFLSQRAEGEVLLTGHSHQAWPNASRDGHIAAWDDAARLVDRKWSVVFDELLPEFRAHLAKRMGSSRPGDIAIAPNTHELVYRLSTCFPIDGTVVTTDAEFHSLSRQLRRLQEEGLKVVTVSAEAEDFKDQFLAAVDAHKPDWCALSQVLFTTSRVMTDLDDIVDGLNARGVPVLVDAYHAFNAIEMHADRWKNDVFVTGGGYKYAQTGEGACFMLLPENAEAYRPKTTGWFADFANLESRTADVTYASGGDRFFGATFDPTPIYRGVYTMRFMDEAGLDPKTLRVASLARTALIIEQYDRSGLLENGITLATPREPAKRGAFVTFQTDDAGVLFEQLTAMGIRTDHRGPLLRLGPSPMTTSDEITRAMAALATAARAK